MNRILLGGIPLVLIALVAGCGDQSSPAAAPSRPARVDDGSAEVAKGLEALAQHDSAAAAAAFTTATLKCETNFEAQVNLAMVQHQLGNIDNAAAAAAKALEICPESAEARLVDGQVAYLQKDYKRALADFAAVTGEKTLPAALRSEAWAARGVVELAQDIPDTARISFLRAMLLNRRNASAWYHLGVLSRDTYRIPEAACEQFQMAGRLLDARDARAKKISRDILPALRKAIGSQPPATKLDLSKRDPAASAKLLADGKAQRQRNEITRATKTLTAAYKADPLSGPAALAYAQIRELRAKTSAEVDEVLVAYRTAIDQNPAAQTVYLEAARLAYKHGRWSTAVAIMDRAVAHDPENRQTLDLLVAALQKAGKNKQAEAWKTFRSELR